MNDTEMMDWLDRHVQSFMETAPKVFTLRYLDGRGVLHRVRGTDLRDCVRIAVGGFKPEKGILHDINSRAKSA